MGTFSFLDVKASLVGPGGAISLGSGSGSGEEGISIDPSEPINNLVVGADGQSMHSLNANKSGMITVRLLKTSPVNAQLMAMYDLQTASPALHGKNTFSLVTTQGQDAVTCSDVAFKVRPNLNYQKTGGINVWVFDAGRIDEALGTGY